MQSQAAARGRCCSCSPTRRPPRRSGGRTPAAGPGARARHAPAAHGDGTPATRSRSPATTATDARHRGVHLGARKVTWNGKPVRTRPTTTGSLTGTIPAAAAGHAARSSRAGSTTAESPEAQPRLRRLELGGGRQDDDQQRHAASARCRCSTPTTTASTPATPGTAAASAAPARRPASTSSRTPAAGPRRSRRGSTAASSAAPPPAAADFAFPAGSVQHARRQRPLRAHGQHGPRGGLQLDQRQQDGPRAHQRLADRRAANTITWRLQGVRGGEDEIDPVRGPLSTGGLYGERAGWSLPGYPDGGWKSVTLPTSVNAAGRVVVSHPGDAAPPAGPGHVARADVRRRPVAQVPRDDVRQRLAARQLRQLRGPAALLPDPQRHPEPARAQHASRSPCGTWTAAPAASARCR